MGGMEQNEQIIALLTEIRDQHRESIALYKQGLQAQLQLQHEAVQRQRRIVALGTPLFLLVVVLLVLCAVSIVLQFVSQPA